MDIMLLGITIVSLVVALVMSVAAWRLSRDEKKRSAARVAALSLAAAQESPANAAFESAPVVAIEPKPLVKAPWASPAIARAPQVATGAAFRASAPIAAAAELPLNQPARFEAARINEAPIAQGPGFLGATDVQAESGSRQKTLAIAAMILFVALSGGVVWMMSGPRGTSAAAVGPNSPLELVSLSHQRQNDKLAVSGLVRNPASGKPLEHLSAVVFLFDKTGTFVTSSRANVDFLKLGAGDESPFVVSLDAPATVARYRVSFRTDDGIVPHVDRRETTPAETVGIQPSAVKSSVGSHQ